MLEIVNDTKDYLIHLLKCALYGVKPEEKPENITFSDVFNLARFHSVANMAYYSIEKLIHKPEADLDEKWKEIRDRAIIKGITQLYERDCIIKSLTDHGINIVPLKGCYIKEMYPSSDMRVMSDLDILMESSSADKVKEVFIQLGYQVEHFGVSNHDVYMKKPIMNVEMHKWLIDEQLEIDAIYQYYHEPWHRFIQDEANPHLYRMKWEDYYIFFLVHFYKHYKLGGSGIRSILDLHIFLSKHKSELNQEYLQEELEKLNLTTFRRNCERLADIWFSEDGRNIYFYNNELLNIQEYIVYSGTYGVVEHKLENIISRKLITNKESLLKYIFNRMFPTKNKIVFSYPILKKCPMLLPLCWIHRLLKVLLLKRRILRIELQKLKEVK